MDGRTLEVTQKTPNITVIEGVTLPDFEQLEREAREEKEQTLEHLRGVAHSARLAQTTYVTLGELADVVGVHKSSLGKLVRKEKLSHSYGRVPSSPQNQMLFTKEEAEAIIQDYFSGEVE